MRDGSGMSHLIGTQRGFFVPAVSALKRQERRKFARAFRLLSQRRVRFLSLQPLTNLLRDGACRFTFLHTPDIQDSGFGGTNFVEMQREQTDKDTGQFSFQDLNKPSCASTRNA